MANDIVVTIDDDVEAAEVNNDGARRRMGVREGENENIIES